MTAETAAREALCRTAHSLYQRGLTHGSTGNLSIRLDDGWLMSPTGASLGELDPVRLSRLDADGRHISGDKPTKESFLHLAMYRQRPGSGAVVHLHSTHSVAVSVLAELDPADLLPRSVRWPASITPCCWPTTDRWSPAVRSPPPPMRSRNSKPRRDSICCCAASNCGCSARNTSPNCVNATPPEVHSCT